MLERRLHPRIETPPHVAAYEQIAVRGYGDLCDISRSGVRLKTLDRSELGSIFLTFKLPPSKRPISVNGRVIWIRESRSRDFEVGVAFNLLSDEIRLAIDDFFIFRGILHLFHPLA